jgi:GNAT superfamily N-acetyltransferase
VKVECFECGAIIEADGTQAVADAFVVHARESHTWPYPEEAIRTYAHNYAEATERMSGDTERRPVIGEVAVHRVTEDRIEDWLQFFDHDAFAGNPSWASCYCLEPHVPTTGQRPWRESRSTMVELLQHGSSYGYLAYVDGQAAGWVNASLRADYRLYGDVEDGGPEPGTIVGVSCFVVAPPYRRHGIAAALLDRVIADASARGAAWIEAYPANAPAASDAGHFRGPRSMYDARGFEPIEERERYTIVRRPAGNVHVQ